MPHRVGFGLVTLLCLFTPAAWAEDGATHGAELFSVRCALCHAVEGGGGGQGPSLAGVVGRKAGTAAFGYSPALRQVGWTWDAAHLDRYLAGPQAAVPGTRMPVAVPDAGERRDIIAYLSTLQPPAPAEGAGAPASEPPEATGDVRTGAAAFGDWRGDAPGVRRRIEPRDLPAPFATRSAGNSPGVAARPPGRVPVAPPGFRVDLFSDAMEDPRVLRVAPNGDVFVAETAAGRVSILRAAPGSPKAERAGTFASGLDGPFGIAFFPPGPEPRFVYVAENDRVLRFPYRSGDVAAAAAPTVVVPRIAPTSGGHTTRDLVVTPDGSRLVVSVGSASNVPSGLARKTPAEAAAWDYAHGLGATWGPEEDRADLLSFAPDGTDRRNFATGLRNCVGLAVEPRRGAVWCATNERDGLGDDLVPDYVTAVRPGAFYGWPWRYIGDTEEPRLAGLRPELAGRMTEPDVLLQPHSAALGLTFYDGATFPERYRGHAFAALHGSWNRGRRTGYKVVRIPIANGVATGAYEDFLTGFVIDDRSVWGRPVGLAVARDGALLVSEDANNTIWRVAPVPR